MKKPHLKMLFAGIALAAGVVLSTVAPAAEAKTAIPATSAAILTAVDEQSAELQKLVTNGALADVHRIAFAIRDLVAALPDKSAGLSPDKTAALKSDARFVATIARRLDEQGDTNDRAGAQAEYAKLVKVLTHLHAIYSR